MNIKKQNSYLDPYIDFLSKHHFSPYLYKDDVIELKKEINSFSKEEQLIAAAYVLSHMGTSQKQKNWVWSTYCIDSETTSNILNILDDKSLNTCLSTKFKYVKDLSDYIIKNNRKGTCIEYLLYLNDDIKFKVSDSIHDKIVSYIGKFLWNNISKLDKLLNLYESENISSYEFYEVLKEHFSFKQWLNTNPTLEKIEKTIKYLINNSYELSIDNLIVDIGNIAKYQYIKNNVLSAQLLGLDQCSGDEYLQWLLKKPITSEIEPLYDCQL